MKLQINPDLLSDAPYHDKNKGLFISPQTDFQHLTQDIQLGTSTCYLISGYRGAGKTSFIKQLGAALKDKPDKDNREILFVYTHFADYQSKTNQLRKLIRALYQELKNLKSFKVLKKEERFKPLDEKSTQLVEELYEKTFYETYKANLTSEKKERLQVVNKDLIPLLQFLLPVLATAFFILNVKYHLLSLPDTVNYSVILVSVLAGIQGFLKISFTTTRAKAEQEDFNRKSMFDDEIADFQFHNLLKELYKKYKVVFVLDELDKVADDEIDKLLNELKPHLVSGAATFIVVAGQTLYYKYEKSKSEDDSLLSSIFAKCIHIPLLSREEFNLLIGNLIMPGDQLTDEEEIAKNSYVDWLIFQSKRIPRKFINLIRSELHWEDGHAFLEIDSAGNRFIAYTQILDIINDIDDNEIAAEVPDKALRDFLVMQLLIETHEILSSKKISFSVEDIIKGYE